MYLYKQSKCSLEKWIRTKKQHVIGGECALVHRVKKGLPGYLASERAAWDNPSPSVLSFPACQPPPSPPMPSHRCQVFPTLRPLKSHQQATQWNNHSYSEEAHFLWGLKEGVGNPQDMSVPDICPWNPTLGAAKSITKAEQHQQLEQGHVSGRAGTGQGLSHSGEGARTGQGWLNKLGWARICAA
jgi:hypothetical protein